MKIMKFGGSSLSNEHRLGMVTNIIATCDTSAIIVLSAMGGVTNTLIDMADRAVDGDTIGETLDALKQRHLNALRMLADGGSQDARDEVESHTKELSSILRGVTLVRECSSRTRDYVLSFGERLSCIVMTAILQQHNMSPMMVDAREIIITDNQHGNANIDFEETYRRIRERFTELSTLAVVPGFIASNGKGITTTLGRDGSDYTASILGAALHAESVEIWTDVNGVMSADPRRVDEAFVLPKIGFQEAMELSYFGAQVIHPYTMIPVVEMNIPVNIRNTMNPTAPGTCICEQHSGETITGIASIPDVALVNIVGSGMVGASGTLVRIFSALADANINVIMISQASSEHSICVICRSAEARQAARLIETGLAMEITIRRIEPPELIEDMEIVAVVGANMRGIPGISGKLFSALGTAGINVLAIAQGSSELNISFVISKADATRALQVLHAAFFSSRNAATSDGATSTVTTTLPTSVFAADVGR